MTHVQPKDRDIAMVFQSYALYPHMTVRENIEFPLKLAKLPKNEIDEKVAEASRILDLDPYLDRKPSNLSGGQRQRVAMGRAIVRRPKVFLMDEPLSNLDAKLRVQTRTQVAALQRELGVTTVYVTHDQVEAMTMGDRVAVLKDGILQQVAPPRELYDAPVNEFVAGFIGSPSMNLFPAEGVTLGVRPETMRVVVDKQIPEGWVARQGTVDLVEELGSESYVYATSEGVRLVARLGDQAVPERGAPVTFAYDPAAAHRFDPATGERV